MNSLKKKRLNGMGKGRAKNTPKRRISAKSSGTSALLLFVAKFFIIYFILTALLELADLSWLTSAIAFAAAAPMGFAVLGSTVLVNGELFLVTNLCTGLMSASILAAIIFSARRPSFLKKLGLFVAGLVALLVFNIPRLMLVLYSAKLGMDAELVHTLTWFLMSALVLAIWFFGMKKICGIKDFNGLL